MKERAAPDRDLEAALRGAQAGDEAAFRTLYRDLQPRLLRYLRALVGGEAEDVAADAWLQIARDLGSFEGDYDRFRGWATTIARHRALDHLRRLGRRPDASVHIDDVTDLTGGDDTERDALERLSTGAAVALICGLPRDQAEAVLLRVVVGLDAKEAGRVLGKRSGAVRTAAYRGLRRLAERLAEQPEHPEQSQQSGQPGQAARPGEAREAGEAAAAIERQPSGAHGAPPPDAAR
ncbi:RNA polymerase sigma factor [Actinomadura sp. 21ATH]|uniref:RNA polymerase sigma factor n=1 Tax=Actinomadura sp. 21ATH TaxID=1735444 RepID=UPI0035C0A53A